MSATVPCLPCTVTTETTNVPGTAGANAYTLTTAAFVVPADEADVTIVVGNTAWMVVGATVVITGPYHFIVQSIGSTTGVTLKWKNYSGDAATGLTVASGATVSPAGPDSGITTPISLVNGGFGASNASLGAARSTLLAAALDAEAVLANNTGDTADNTIAAGVGMMTLEIPHTFIGGTSAVESVTDLVLGFNFKILSWHFVTSVLLVGAGGSRIANLEINSTNVGGEITIPIANAAVGTITNAAAVSGTTTGDTNDTLSIEIQSGGTAFTAGSGIFVIRIQNTDTVHAVSSLAAKLNTVLTALKP